MAGFLGQNKTKSFLIMRTFYLHNKYRGAQVAIHTSFSRQQLLKQFIGTTQQKDVKRFFFSPHTDTQTQGKAHSYSDLQYHNSRHEQFVEKNN